MYIGTFFMGKNHRDPLDMVDVWKKNRNYFHTNLWATVHKDFFTDMVDGLYSKIQESDDDGVECVIITAERYQEIISKGGCIIW